MDFNNKPEEGFGGDFSNDNTFGNTNIFDNNQNFGSSDTHTNNVYNAPNSTPGNGVYTPNPAPGNGVYTPNPAPGNGVYTPNPAPGNGVYTPNPTPVNNTYNGGNNYYSNPTPPGDFDRFSSFGGQKETPVTLGDWMLTYLIMCIPCVNVIMMFVWAFSSGTKKSKSNYFKATLLWAAIYILICVVIVFLFGGLGALSAASY